MTKPDKPVVEDQSPNTHFDARLREYSFWRRIQIPIIAAAVHWFVRVIGFTLRFEILGWQHAERAYANKQRIIWTFWHSGILGVLWWGRNRGVVVLHSTNFDGQWIGRVIRRFGFGTALGSSTRGGLSGLAELQENVEKGRDAGFTVDGPRGPRSIAKPGPVILARVTGSPIAVFAVGYDHATTLKSTWDHFRIPRPFARVILAVAPPIHVPRDADREVMDAKCAEMQRELDRTQGLADSWFKLSPVEQAKERERWNA